MPVRALGEGGELCPGLSTAVPRWRPPGRLWKRRGAWHGRKGSSARQQAGEELWSDAWVPARSKGMAGKALHGDGEKTEQGAGEVEKGIYLKFPNF